MRIKRTEEISDARPYKCDICSKRFKRRGNLKSHQTVHSEIRAHECRYCNKTFKWKSGLRAHELSHGKRILTPRSSYNSTDDWTLRPFKGRITGTKKSNGVVIYTGTGVYFIEIKDLGYRL